ncbi:hypothetical protein, partial [Pleomorphovibrio marinus]|uniref:hypothetical protein n=1 Tax=Pleomorphovibrio marinus TaxID=2164132 RepID=UPI0013009C5E
LVACKTFAQAQEIESRNSRFFYEGNRLQPRMMLDIMRDSPGAYEEMRTAKVNYDVAQVMGFIGGGMIGWPLGAALGGGDPNWLLAGIGGGIVLSCIPMVTAYSKRSKAAVVLYNEGLRGSSMRQVHIHLASGRDGVGLRILF